MDFLTKLATPPARCSTTATHDRVHCQSNSLRRYYPQLPSHVLSAELSPRTFVANFAFHAPDHHGRRRYKRARGADGSAGHRAPSPRPCEHHARRHSTHSGRREGGCRGSLVCRRCAQPGARVLHELPQAAVRTRLAAAGTGCRICGRKFGGHHRQYVSTVFGSRDIGPSVSKTTCANILAEPVLIASNWAVASWCGVSVVSYQVCQYYRSKEKNGMKQAQELMEKKRASIEAKREARRRAREEHDRQEAARKQEEERKRSWGYWYEKNVKFW
jgi:hypothetical protein